MQYLAYHEYSGIGGTLDPTAFNRHIHRACGIIDNATHKRIEKMSSVPEQAKALCRELIDYLAAHKVTEKTIASKSQSAGSVSESESYTVKTKEEQAQDIDDMICDYLMSVEDDNGTPLLYRGCSA